MMNKSSFIFNMDSPITEGSEMDRIMKELMNGPAEAQALLAHMIQERLIAISQTSGAKTTSAEDRYLAWALHSGNKMLETLAKTVACQQLDNYVTQEVRKFNVNREDAEDMQQDAFEQVIRALPKYNGEKKLSTYARLFVKDALVRHLGKVDYSTNKKWRLWLQGAITASMTRLKMAGIDHPTPAQISEELNGQGLYRPVSETNIIEALNLKKVVVSLDDTDTVDDGEGRSRHETVADAAPSPEDICVKKDADKSIQEKLDEIIQSLDTVMQYIWLVRLESFQTRGKDVSQQRIIEEIKDRCPNYTRAFIKSAVNRFDTVMYQKMVQYDPGITESDHIVERVMEILSEM